MVSRDPNTGEVGYGRQWCSVVHVIDENGNISHMGGISWSDPDTFRHIYMNESSKEVV